MTASPGTAAVSGDYAHVFRPLRLRSLEIANRILITGHSVLYGEHGHLSDRHRAYYETRARAGVGLLVTEQQAAHPAGRNYHAGLVAYDPSVVPAYRRVTDAVHAHGTPILAQLFCSGPQGLGTQYMDEWQPLMSPSGIRSTQFGELPAVMSATDIAAVRDSFVRSARNVVAGGFDGIEIHAAHSQLLGSFLSPAFNHRGDAYGGSVANRCRLVVEIALAVREAIGEGLVLGVRLNTSEYLDGAGIEPAEAEEHVARLAESGALDFFDLSAGGYFAKAVAVPPMASPLQPGFLAEHTTRLKGLLAPGQALFSVGRITRLAQAEALLAAGAADMVGMTRAHMADPEHLPKARGGRDDIRYCIGANVCSKRLGENVGVSCVLNPAMGREAAWPAPAPLPAAARRRVAVVGAGPAGLRAAATAAAFGHAVTVFESRPSPGGRLRLLAPLPMRAAWGSAIDSLVRGARAAGAALETDAAADPAMLAGLAPEVVLVATGASWDVDGYTPFRPGRATVPGLDGMPVRRLGLADAVADAVADPHALGRRVAIVDESLDPTPIALALHLAEAGVAVTVVSPMASYGDGLGRTYELPYFWGRLERAGATILEKSTLDGVGADGSLAVGSLFSPAVRDVAPVDTLVFAAGRTPCRRLADDLAGTGPTVRLIGDAVAPRSVEAVIHEGEKAARELSA